MLPVPSTLPGTNRMSFSFVVLFILVKFTTRLDDDGFIVEALDVRKSFQKNFCFMNEFFHG